VPVGRPVSVMTQISRRRMLGAVTAALTPALQAARPKGYLVENTTHMFSGGQDPFPYHPNGTSRPRPLTVETYSKFALEAKIDHTVIVQSEVYQDDHRYLEYCFQHEPSPGFLRAPVCLTRSTRRLRPAFGSW
jgi:hypothetical protein